MLVEGQDITLGNAAQLRGDTAAGAPNIRYIIAYIPHPLPTRVTGGRDSSPNSTIRIGADRWPTQVIKDEHPSRTRLSPSTNHHETLGPEFT